MMKREKWKNMIKMISEEVIGICICTEDLIQKEQNGVLWRKKQALKQKPFKTIIRTSLAAQWLRICQYREHKFDFWSGKIPLIEGQLSLYAFLPGESQGQGSLVGCHSRTRVKRCSSSSKPVSHNYWDCTLETALRNKKRHRNEKLR